VFRVCWRAGLGYNDRVSSTARALARSSVLIAALLLCANAFASDGPDCFPPGPPQVPDGDSASETEMIAAQQRMKLFREAATTYMTCIDDRISKGTGRVSERKMERWTKQREKVATSIEKTITDFNTSVRSYKTRQEGSAPAPEEPEPAASQPRPADPSPSSASDRIVIPD
jgi:hypothetical protein